MFSKALIMAFAFVAVLSALSMPVLAYGPIGTRNIDHYNTPERVVYVNGQNRGVVYNTPRVNYVAPADDFDKIERYYTMRFGNQRAIRVDSTDRAQADLQRSQMQKVMVQEDKFIARQQFLEHKLQASKLSDEQKRTERAKLLSAQASFNSAYQSQLRQRSDSFYRNNGYYMWS